MVKIKYLRINFPNQKRQYLVTTWRLCCVPNFKINHINHMKNSTCMKKIPCTQI